MSGCRNSRESCADRAHNSSVQGMVALGGPLADVADATATSIALLARWVGSEPTVRIEGALPGRVIEAESWDELADFVDARDIRLLRSLRIDVGERLGPRIGIRFERRSFTALTLDVAGDDRARSRRIRRIDSDTRSRKADRTPDRNCGANSLHSRVASPYVCRIGSEQPDQDLRGRGAAAGSGIAILIVALLGILIVEGLIGGLIGRRLFRLWSCSLPVEPRSSFGSEDGIGGGVAVVLGLSLPSFTG